MPLKDPGFNDLFEVEAVTPKELEATTATPATQSMQNVFAELEDSFNLEPVNTPAWSTDLSSRPESDPGIVQWGKNLKKEFLRGIGGILQGIGASYRQNAKSGLPMPNPAAMGMTAGVPVFTPSFAPSEYKLVAEEAKKRGAVTDEDYRKVTKDIWNEKWKEASDNLLNVSNKLMDQPPTEYAYWGKPGVMNTAVGILESITTNLALTTPGMVTTWVNPAVGFTVNFELFKGLKYKEYIDKGIDPDVADKASDISGAINSVLETAGGLLGKGMSINAFTTMANKSLKLGPRVAHTLYYMLMGGAGEGLEEYLQAYPDELADIYAKYPDAEPLEIAAELNKRVTNWNWQRGAGEQAAWGAASGMFLSLVGAGAATPAMIKDYVKEKQATNTLSRMYKAGVISDEQATAIINSAPPGHPIIRAIQKVQQERTQAPNNVAGEVTIDEVLSGETQLRAEPIPDAEAPIQVQRSSEEAGENTQYEVMEGPQKGSSISRGAINQTPEKYTVNEELMSVVADKAKVGDTDQLAKDLERLQAAKGNKAVKEKVALTHYSPITGLSELEGSPLKSQEQSYSRRDVGKRKDQSTKEYPYVPLVYFYGPNVTPEPSVKSSAQSIYDVEVDPAEIYNGAADPNKYAEQAYKIIQASQGMQPNVINVFSKLVKDAGYKGFAYAAGNNLEERWYVMFDKVPAKERVIGESNLQAVSKQEETKTEKGGKASRKPETKKVVEAAAEAAKVNKKKPVERRELSKREKRNVERIKDAIAKGYIKEGSPEYAEVVKKYGKSIITTPTSKQFKQPTNYPDAIKNAGTSMDNNIYVRRGNAPEVNTGRVLLIQISNLLINPRKRTSTLSAEEEYYAKLYTKRSGYSRPLDFWEIPEWQSIASGLFPQSDLYVVRNMDKAKQFLTTSGYDAILFSTQDVSKVYQKELAQAFPGKVVLGGYADPKYFKDVKNSKWYNSLEDAATDILGNAAGKVTSDYTLYSGTETIPRLCLSQGCLHKCAFCTVPKNLTISPKEAVAIQVKAFKDLKFKLVYLNDKTFGQAANYTDLVDINKEIKKYNKEFRGFIIQTTAAQMKKFSNEFLQNSGIKYVELGVESYNDDILKKLHKPASTKLIDDAVIQLRRNDIAFIPNIMVGLTGKGWSETKTTYQNTLDFLNTNKDIISHVNLYNLALYEGTELTEQIGDVTEKDLDENAIAKSFHKDPELHKWFNDQVIDYATRQLDKEPKAESIKQSTVTSRLQATKDITTTKEFKTFFGNSKVVDENGKPLVVYHGTDESYDSFDLNKTRSEKGIFFTNSKFVASNYAMSRRGVSKNIIPAYLSIKNPLIVDFKGQWKERSFSKEINEAKRNGNDGVIIRDVKDVNYYTEFFPESDIYIAFEPTQIKSVFNKGTFDPNDPRILFQAQKQPTPSPSLSPQVKVVLRSKKPIATTTLNTVKRTHNLIISSLQQMGISDDVISAINFKYSQLIDLSKIPGLEYATNFHKTSKRNIDVKTAQQVMAATTFLTDQSIIMRFATSLLQDASTITQTGWHEGWHIIEKLGLIDPEAFKAMKELMPNPEDRAEAAREYMVDNSSKAAMKQPNWLRRVFERIKKILFNIADKLRGIKQLQSYNEILDAQIRKLQRQHNRMLIPPAKKVKREKGRSLLQAVKEEGLERKDPAPWAFHALTRKLETTDIKTIPKKKESLLNWVKKFAKPEEIKWLGVEDYLSQQVWDVKAQDWVDRKGDINIQDFTDYVKANEVSINEVSKDSNITVADPGRVQVKFDELAPRKVTGYKFKVGEVEFEIEPQSYSPIEDGDQLYILLRDGIQETDPADLHYTALTFDRYNDLKLYIQDELTKELPEDEEYVFEEKEWEEYINKILDDKNNQVPYEFKDIEATLYDELSGDQAKYYIASELNKTYTVYRKGSSPQWEEEGNYPDLPQAQAVVYDEEERWVEQIMDDPYYESEEGSTRYEEYTLPGGEDYTELLLIWDNPPSGTTFHSGHWSEENILAHVRFKTRKDNEGRRVLFIEEVQSDWHQKGKEKGYNDLEKRFEELDNKLKQGKSLTKDEQIWYNTNASKTFVPDAPFRNVWHEVVLKYMLRYAADNKYDLMAWTTGKQQNDRYNLEKLVKRIEWNPPAGGLAVWDSNGDKKFIQVYTENDLQEYLGTSLTKQLLSNKTTKEDGSTLYSLEGPELRMGGEGMIEFYDHKIPAFLRKYIKQWGIDLTTISIDEIRKISHLESYYTGPEYTREQIDQKYREAVKDANSSAAIQMQLRQIGSLMLHDNYTFKQAMAKNGSIALAAQLGGQLITPYTSPIVSAIPITEAMSSSLIYTGQSLFQAAPTISTPPSIPAIQKQQLNLTLTTGGSTISQSGVNMAGKPFIAMSVLKQREIAIKDRDITLDDLASFWEKNKDALSSNPDLTVGTWVDRETNTTYIDLSLTLPKSLQPQIMSLARKFGQKAIFDLSTFSEIFVRNPAKDVPTPEEQLKMIEKLVKTTTAGPEKPNTLITTARQEALQQTRELLGLDTLDSAEKRSWSEALSKAKEKDYHNHALDIASTVINTPTALSDIETAGLVIATAKLRNAHEAALKQLGASTDPTTTKMLSNSISRIEDEFDVLSKALTLSGTEKGRALASQKLAINQNYDLVSILSRAKAAKGAPLTQDERKKFEDMVNQLKQAQDNLDKTAKDVDTNKAQQTISRITRDGLNKYAKMSDVEKDAALIKTINKYKANPTAEDLVDISLNIGSRPDIRYIDTIVRHINKHLPGIKRSDVVNAIIQTTRHKQADTNEIVGKLAAIKREAREDKALRNTISTLEDILNQGDVPVPQTRVQKAVSDTIQQLRLHRNRLRKNISQSDPVRVARVTKQINALTRKLTTGDIIPIPKLAIPKSKQLLHLEYQRDRLRKEIRERIRAMKPHTIWDQILEPLRSARTLKTMLDLSAVLRQGVITFLSHPVVALKSTPAMFTSIASDEKFYNEMRKIEADPDFLLAKQAKLFIAERDGQLAGSEEVYVSRWLNKIPGLNFLKDASERTYTIYLNKLRMDTFKVLIRSLSLTGEPTLAEAQAIADYINVTTGRGSLGSLQSASNVLNSIFFAPRFAISRFQFILGQPFYQGNARTRKLIAKEYARFLLGALVVLFLGWLAGGDLEDNPQSPDFGKIRFGNTRLDPFGGLAQVTTFLSRLGVRTINSLSKIVGGKRVFAQAGKATSWDTITRFLRGKLAPLTSIPIDIINDNKNVVGEPVRPWDLITPMSFQDIYDVFKEQDIPLALALSTLAFFGMSLQTYESRKKRSSN